MPKTKSKRRSTSKASSSKRTAAKTKTRAASTPKSRTRKPAAIDPRVLAAIGLALEDERIANERDEALRQPTSGWVVLGRARGVRTR